MTERQPGATGEPALAWLEQRLAKQRKAAVDFDSPGLEYRRVFSEVWGTFLLVLVAAGGGVIGATAFGTDLTLATKALAPGIMVLAIIFFMGTISGAHLNPAVTLAFAVRGNFPWLRVPGYIAAQVIGAILASLVDQWMYGGIIHSVILRTASGARNIGRSAPCSWPRTSPTTGSTLLAPFWAG